MNASPVLLGQLASVAQGLNISGRGAGSTPGDWAVQLVDSADIQDDVLALDGLRPIHINCNAKTEKHVLRPYDVLVTARSTSIKVALVPPTAARTVAGATLLVISPFERELGVGHFLWYFLTSAYGRSLLAGRMTAGVTIASLAAGSVAEIPIPLPGARELHCLASLVEESERAYGAALEAAVQRRTTIRDHIVDSLRRRSSNAVEHQ